MPVEQGTQVLHWRPEQDRWDLIAWPDWMAFRGILAPPVPLAGIAGGIHYFLVCIHDRAQPVNFIPHMYLIEPDGRIGPDNFAGLTAEDRADYGRLMVATTMPNADDAARLDEIRRKMDGVYHPPGNSAPALRRVLQKPPKPGSNAERFLAELESYRH